MPDESDPPNTPYSDEQLEAITIGPRTPHNSTITLAPYDPHWPQRFEEHAQRIRAALGDTALQLEHVGSTAVPGLSAKPIIDILLVVPDAAGEADYVPPLEQSGYRLHLREPHWYQHRLFKAPDGAYPTNIHTFSPGCPEIERMLRFRDHLRAHEADRLLYEKTKQTLAAQTWKHVQNYADAKSQVVATILSRARGDEPAQSRT